MKKEIMDQAMDYICDEVKVPAAVIVVHKDGREIYSRVSGSRDVEKKVPLKKDDLFWLYSMSKVYTCTLAMKLMEEGKMALDDPVKKYIPEFADLRYREDGRLCEKDLTIRHLMTMTGGFDYQLDTPAIEALRERTGNQGSTLESAIAIGEGGVKFTPGEHFEYSLCHDVLGAVMEVAGGKTFEELLHEKVLDPLKITDLDFFPNDAQKDRIVDQYDASIEPGKWTPVGTENLLPVTLRHESGGAGLFGNADSYIKLADALANADAEGKTGIPVILSPESIRRMSQNELSDVCMTDLRVKFMNHGLECFGYGLGVRTRIKEDGTSPVGEFGWDGAAGGYVLIDPVNHVTMVYLQNIMNHGFVYSDIHPMLRTALYKALEQ